MQPQIIIPGSIVVPACEACGHTTRLVGLERSLSGNGDIATYQCTSCANVQAHARSSPIRSG